MKLHLNLKLSIKYMLRNILLIILLLNNVPLQLYFWLSNLRKTIMLRKITIR